MVDTQATPSLIYTCLALTTFAVVIGIIGQTLAHKKSNAQVRKRSALKFLVFVVLVYTLLGLCLFVPKYFIIVPIASSVFGIWEIWISYLCSKKPVKFILPGFATFVCATFGLCSFLFVVEFSGAQLVVAYLAIVFFDAFSQVVGQLLGKFHFVPSISAAKTIEGLVGGLIAAQIVELVCCGQISLSILVLCLGALLGDLAKSSFKRQVGIKDFPETIPGHGGFLDRFDSLLGGFTALWLLYSHFPNLLT